MHTERKRILLEITLFLFIAVTLFAQDVWEGDAIVGRYGEFPPGGLYAASNAFPLNSVIEVTNPGTGETQRLIVAQRAENAGVLLVVSQAAAEALGVSRRATFRVQIEPVNMPSITSVSPSEDLPFHPDPDINPRAPVGDPSEELPQPEGEESEGEPEPKQGPDAEPAPEPEPEAEPEAPAEPAPEPPAEEPEEPEEEPAEEPAAEESPVEEPSEPDVIVELDEEPPETPSEETPPGEPEAAEPPSALSAADEEFHAALALPQRPEERGVEPELPVAPVEETLEVEASPVVPEFPNPVELSVNLPIAPPVETPEEGTLPPRRPEEELPGDERISMAMPGDEVAPDMRDELTERPGRPEGATTDIPLRIVEEPAPPEPEEGTVARPSRTPTEEVVSLEPAEFRPPEPPEPEAEDEMITGRPEPTDSAAASEVTEAPTPPETEAPAESPEVAAVPEPTVPGRTTPDATPPGPSPEEELGELSIATTLPEGGYYLQIGAFSDSEGVRSAVDQLGEDFPIQVVSSEGEMYRVYVGPLAEDERGAVLYLVRARGYRDAFLRKADG